jgi:hypothetical protein
MTRRARLPNPRFARYWAWVDKFLADAGYASSWSEEVIVHFDDRTPAHEAAELIMDRRDYDTGFSPLLADRRQNSTLNHAQQFGHRPTIGRI